MAIGLDDFAGTGYFSREYLVSTYSINKFKASIGIGWGKFVGESSFDNPLTFISEGASFRPPNTGTGTPSTSSWFRGDASLFGGLEYSFKRIKGFKFKIEYDPYDYEDFSANNRNDVIKSLRDKDSNINIGFSYPVNKFITIDTSYIKGNDLNLSLNFTIPLNDYLQKKKVFEPNIIKESINNNPKYAFYDDLLFNLNKNNLLLQTANLDNKEKLDVSISTSNYRNSIRSSSYSANIAYEVAKLHNYELTQINITHINTGIEQNQISYVGNHLSDKNIPIEIVKRNTDLSSGKPSRFNYDEYKPKVIFPAVFSNFSPTLMSHIGNPEKFFFGGIDFEYKGEVQFSRNLILSSKLNLPIYETFKDTISGPGSNMEHVRTDLVQYLKEDDIHITRLQLDYIWSPLKSTYARLSAGIFEEMYGGIGFETLYKPFNRNFYVGAELFNVKKRSFNQRFNFEDYKTITGHINLGYIFSAGVEANLSFGRYLAKDDGYTLDISRRLISGFKTGIYFTRTNVSKELFGEGSFDKGFYFQIPLDLFSSEYNSSYSTFKLSPLTRDGGAKLIFEKDLRGLMYNSARYEIERQWDGFRK